MIPGTRRRAANLTLLDGQVTDVEWYLKGSPHGPSRKVRGKKREGLVFEAQVSDVLQDVRPPWFYVRSPWIRYRADGLIRHAQPDGLLVNFQTGQVVCCEMKLRHTARAEVQMLGKYQPLLLDLFPSSDWRLYFVEIFKIWDFVESGMRRTEVFNLAGWQGPHCYGWRGEVPAGLYHTAPAGRKG